MIEEDKHRVEEDIDQAAWVEASIAEDKRLIEEDIDHLVEEDKKVDRGS